jgi:thiol-disulfide isomerase/thioredoxin
VVWAACLQAQQPEEPEQPKGVMVSGQVFDHLGAGVTGVSVRVRRVEGDRPAGEVLAETTSGEYGDFSLELPPGARGSFSVSIAKKGYAKVERVIELSPGEPAPFVDVQMEGTLSLEGRVKKLSDEAPIPGAKVTVTDGYGTWEGASDQAGRFVVRGIPPQSVEVTVEAEGFASVKKRLPTMSETEPIEVWMEPGWSAVVQVVDPLGTPMPEVLVEALTEARERLWAESTDANGEVRFEGLGPKQRLLRLRFTHFALPRADEFDYELLRSGDETEVRERFEVELAARIKGVIRDGETGEPIYSARVMAGEHIGGSTPKAWTDPEGTYSLVSLSPGTVVLTVHSDGYAPALKEVEVGAGRTKNVDFELEPGRTLRGRVVGADGRPVAGAQVMATQWRGHATAGLAVLSDEEGRFVLEHAPEGSLELTAGKPGYLSQVQIADGDGEVRFELVEGDSGAGGEVPAAKYGVGDEAPDVSFTTLDGQKMSLSGLRGKVVLLDFWATWCGPCVAEMPRLKRVQAKYGKRSDFVMIGVSLDRSEARLKDFIEKEKLAWAQVFEGRGWNSGAAREFGIGAIPAIFLIGKDGKIKGVNPGETALNERISKLLE